MLGGWWGNEETYDCKVLAEAVQLRAMHVALSTAQKTPRDPLEIEELWDQAHELLEQGGEHGPEVHELFARLIERAHGIGV